jgi:hypothetical protein
MSDGEIADTYRRFSIYPRDDDALSVVGTGCRPKYKALHEAELSCRHMKNFSHAFL